MDKNHFQCIKSTRLQIVTLIRKSYCTVLERVINTQLKSNPVTWHFFTLTNFTSTKGTTTEFQCWTGLQEHKNSERVELGAQCIHGGERCTHSCR
uniref:Uncharacterized protein n=1 Tax=Anguilla anguilla TaxID=7936 RepID=A0A0E9WP68_ANGAN